MKISLIVVGLLFHSALAWKLPIGNVADPVDIKEKVIVSLCYELGQPATHYKLKDFAKIAKDPNFNSSLPTVIYSHGFQANEKVISTATIIYAYLSRGEHNVIIIDWGFYSKGLYFSSVIPSLKKIGTIATGYLRDFLDTGYPVDRIHLVGHSLGGQLMGLIGRFLKELSGNKYVVGKIIALDPAGPDFYPPMDGSFQHISQSDAKFVEVIHTDARLLGADEKSGTVDFWPNSGKTQPGCGISGILTACSHGRSWEFYSESVVNPTAFIGVKCESWKDFQNNHVTEQTDVALMGFGTRQDLTGDYCLQTNSHPIFGKGRSGIVYST